MRRLKQNKIYALSLAVIILLTLLIRINNLKVFDTSWADDGGARLTYIETLYYENRLPTMEETYVAWHEPVYYYILAGWIKVGDWLGIEGLNWWESFNIVLYLAFLVLVWLFSYYFSKQNKWIALLNTFVFSIIFIGVKLSSYTSNELLLHVLVLLSVVLFYRWQLNRDGRDKKVFWWAVILAITCLAKVTGWVVVIAALLFWLIKYFVSKRKYYLKYIVILIFVVSCLNLPWIVYKQNNYNGYFSINIYDDKPRQNIMTSDGWRYIFAINTHIFTDYPYWYSQPHSYASILLSDSFGNYYNLFHNSEAMEALPEDQAILVGNGQNTTAKLWNSLINTNRVGLLITAIWWIGFAAWAVSRIKKKRIDDYDLFALIVMLGGWSASIFHNLRLPYLEAGVLKAHFIYFTYPILSLIAYRQWWQILKNKLWYLAVVLLPWLIYLLVAWDILMIEKFVK